jgi:hypothetical protein
MVRPFPETSMMAVRADASAAATENVAVPLPVPEEFVVIHGELLEANHVQVDGALTFTAMLPPETPID